MHVFIFWIILQIRLSGSVIKLNKEEYYIYQPIYNIKYNHMKYDGTVCQFELFYYGYCTHSSMREYDIILISCPLVFQPV
jgi:hypothetical protein